MKIILSMLFLMFMPGCFVEARASDDDVNVISYYAVGNSLDGQLLIDKVNVLRFYPVFAMRDGTDTVDLTVYYGSNIYNRSAEKLVDGQYWQVLLPVFKLGEAIQRLEVKVHSKVDERFKRRYKLLAEALQSVADSAKILEQKWSREKLMAVNRALEAVGIGYEHKRLLRKARQFGDSLYVSKRDSVIDMLQQAPMDTSQLRVFIAESLKVRIANLVNLDLYGRALMKIASEKRADTTSIDYLTDKYVEVGSGILGQQIQETGYLARIQMTKAMQIDSLKAEIQVTLETQVADTLRSGPSVRPSDIIVDPDFSGVTILYRNYKRSLRFMPALDPAERMGIFRIRYVPFPIVGMGGNPKPTLRGPLGDNPAVFEVGMAFGDAIVPGDEFVVPEFSFKRLGVAFAITEKLFDDDALIIGLALTYDFNSYGSIGVGGNFAQKETHPYFSFGINKKAFEAVLGSLAGLFR